MLAHILILLQEANLNPTFAGGMASITTRELLYSLSGIALVAAEATEVRNRPRREGRPKTPTLSPYELPLMDLVEVDPAHREMTWPGTWTTIPTGGNALGLDLGIDKVPEGDSGAETAHNMDCSPSA